MDTNSQLWVTQHCYWGKNIIGLLIMEQGHQKYCGSTSFFNLNDWPSSIPLHFHIILLTKIDLTLNWPGFFSTTKRVRIFVPTFSISWNVIFCRMLCFTTSHCILENVLACEMWFHFVETKMFCFQFRCLFYTIGVLSNVAVLVISGSQVQTGLIKANKWFKIVINDQTSCCFVFKKREHKKIGKPARVWKN